MRNSIELTLARLAVRQFMGSRRALWALVLAALPVLLALLMNGEAGTNPAETLDDIAGLFQALIVSVLLPIVALVVGTSVFGAEVDDGTITYVLGKPVPRWRIVLTRIVVAGLMTAAVLVPSTLLTAIIGARGADTPGVAAGFTGAVAVGSFLYCALFVALSLTTRRALVAGLAYVVIWEGLLSNTFGGSRALSVRQYTLSIADALIDAESVNLSQLGVSTALVMAAVVTALVTLHSIRKLRTFEIGEAA
ncbi:MAG TPA: ABC transporter permease subunit [Longimicrobium sp.]|jgi:ABC-2 type transport system permease protein|nr:ABC transporter permease subunit [Longimicrobium sp.]